MSPAGSRPRRSLLALGIVVNVCILIYAKYANFFVGECNRLLALGEIHFDQFAIVPLLQHVVGEGRRHDLRQPHQPGLRRDEGRRAAPADAGGLTIGDLDGDQVPDLAVANSWSVYVALLVGIGDGTFATASFYRVGDRPYSVAIGDLDRLPVDIGRQHRLHAQQLGASKQAIEVFVHSKGQRALGAGVNAEDFEDGRSPAKAMREHRHVGLAPWNHL